MPGPRTIDRPEGAPDGGRPPSGTSPAPPLARSVAQGTVWLILNTAATKGLSLLAQVVLAAVLSQGDFGVYAIALSVSMFATVLRDGGVRQLMIQRQAEYEELIGPVFWLAMTINTLTGLLLAAAAPLAAWVYGDPRIAPILWVIALTIPLGTPGSMLTTRLFIEMRFREFSVIQAVLAAIRYGGSIAMALAGAGPLAFVLPLPVMALADWALTYRCSPERLWSRTPRPGVWPGFLRQTGWVLVGTLGSALINMGNSLVVGLLVPGAVVGVYFFAMQIVSQIGTLVTANVNQVLLPALARIGDDHHRQSRAAARTIRQLMLLAAPLGMGLIPTFEALEQIVWGGKWRAAVLPVSIIAAFYPVTVIFAVPYAALQAWGLFRQWAVLLLLQGAAIMAAGAAGAWAGGTPEAISLASGACLFVSAVVFAIVGLRRCGLGAGAILAAAVPAWALALAAAGIGYLVVTGPAAALHPALRFLVGGGVFGAVFALLARVLLARHVREAVLVVPGRWRPLASRWMLMPDEVSSA